MGKRKKAAKPQGPKKQALLATTFTCLFCNHEDAVTVKLDKKIGIGYLDCKVCGQKFQSQVNSLSAPVDVYGEWVDAADEVAEKGASGAGPSTSQRMTQRAEDDAEEGYEGEGIVGDDVSD